MKSILTLAVVAFLTASLAQAHHSFANVDRSKTVVLKGTVRSVEWASPHVWIWLIVSDASGGQQLWALEGTSPGELMRRGWNKHTVNPGDMVSVEAHPLKDGRPGGSIERVTFSDGHSLMSIPPPPDSR